MVKSCRLLRIPVIALLIFASLACTVFTPRSVSSEQAGLTVLAGSELQDLEPFLPEIQRRTGVKMAFQYTGTLEGAERIAAGEAAGKPVDFAWFSRASYISLLQTAAPRIQDQEAIMLSPVVLGIKTSKAQAWGWVNNPNLTWREIIEKSASGELRYAMSNPASSNSGFSALVGMASALAGQTDALQAQDFSTMKDKLKAFFKGQALTADSSGGLAEQYVRNQDELDGMINYESVLLELNQSSRLQDPLYLVYPKEGILTADYPLLLINPGQRAAYQKVVAFLRSPAFQQKIMTETLRRTVNPQVELSRDFPTQMLVELPFPGSLAVVNGLLSASLGEQVKPVHTYFVLDISQPMKGARLDSLKKALSTLTGANTGQVGRFTRFQNREKVTLMTFNSRVSAPQDFEVDLSQPSSLLPIQTYIDGLRAGGSSALYSALAQAYEQAARDQANEPDRIYSIVLMSYGQSKAGISEKRFLSSYRKLTGGQEIRLFTIFFGDQDMETMQAIAQETGGRMLFAGQDSFSVIFNEIRGYE